MFDEQLNALSGIDFENLCATLISGMGFQVELTKASGDGGIDIIANSSTPLYKGKYIIQCKRYTGTVGEPILRDLYGVVMSERANKGILMTTGTFTRSAVAFAEGKPLELIDISGIQSLIAQTGYQISKGVPTVDLDGVKDILEKGLSYFSFCDLQEDLEHDSSDQTIRGKLGLLLFREATDNMCFPDYTVEERQTLLNTALYYMEPLKRQGISQLKGNATKLQTFVCLWCCAQSAFLLGKQEEAEKYYQVIFGWNELLDSASKNNGLTDCLYSLLVDMISFYTLTEKIGHVSYLTQHPAYKKILQKKKASLLSDIETTIVPQKAEYWSHLLLDLENITVSPCFHLLEINEEKLFGEDILFDQATKTYRTGAITNLLTPTLYKVEHLNREINIVSASGELLMPIIMIKGQA